MEFNFNIGALPQENKVKTPDTDRIYDSIIVGGGPAGLTAAVYCMRKGISTLLVSMSLGGQVNETAGIENYMGYRYIEGTELVGRFMEQLKQFEIALREASAVTSVVPGEVHKITLADGHIYQGRTLIVCTGQSWRKLQVPGEEQFKGRGVAYCATCDAPLFAGKRVAVVGGGNSAVEAAIDLAGIAERVTVIQILDSLTADKVLVDKLQAQPNVTILSGYEVKGIAGVTKVESIEVQDRKNIRTETLPVDGVFIEIGMIPNSSFVKDVLEINQYGEIQVDCACRTSQPGIFAAGDVTSVPFKQIIIAAGEGAKASLSAYMHLLRTEKA